MLSKNKHVTFLSGPPLSFLSFHFSFTQFMLRQYSVIILVDQVYKIYWNGRFPFNKKNFFFYFVIPTYAYARIPLPPSRKKLCKHAILIDDLLSN